MKKLKIFLSEMKKGELGELTKFDGFPVKVDFSRLRVHYEKRGKKLAGCLGEFLEWWEKEGESALFEPLASLLIVYDGGNVKCMRLNRGMSILAVWTIGERLETKTGQFLRDIDNVMRGFLLNVAGSVALYCVHGSLLRWIDESLAQPMGKRVSAQHYMSNENTSADAIEELVRLCRTRETIGADLFGMSMLKPRNTQYAAMTLGERAAERTATPCVPCNGIKCFYYQLGGCHLDKGIDSWLARKEEP
jgi:hypothetical protein